MDRRRADQQADRPLTPAFSQGRYLAAQVFLDVLKASMARSIVSVAIRCSMKPIPTRSPKLPYVFGGNYALADAGDQGDEAREGRLDEYDLIGRAAELYNKRRHSTPTPVSGWPGSSPRSTGKASFGRKAWRPSSPTECGGSGSPRAGADEGITSVPMESTMNRTFFAPAVAGLTAGGTYALLYQRLRHLHASSSPSSALLAAIGVWHLR